MSAVIWGTQDLEGAPTGSGGQVGVNGTVWAYCERLSVSSQVGTKEVYDGDGNIRFRRNWGCKYRVEGTFVPISVSAEQQFRECVLVDDPVLITDTIYGLNWLFLDNVTRERIAGESGPGAFRLPITGWMYPALVQNGVGAFTP